MFAAPSSLSSLSAQSVGLTSAIDGPHFSTSKSVPFRRRLTVSAASASCASTAEKASLHAASSSRSSESLYDVLGVRLGATSREIKAAYRRLALVLHPDAVITDSQRGQGQASGIEFMKVHDAYETLSDPVKRAGYDRTLLWRQSSVKTSPFSMTSSPGFCSGYTPRRTWETDQCW